MRHLASIIPKQEIKPNEYSLVYCGYSNPWKDEILKQKMFLENGLLRFLVLESIPQFVSAHFVDDRLVSYLVLCQNSKTLNQHFPIDNANLSEFINIGCCNIWTHPAYRRKGLAAKITKGLSAELEHRVKKFKKPTTIICGQASKDIFNRNLCFNVLSISELKMKRKQERPWYEQLTISQ